MSHPRKKIRDYVKDVLKNGGTLAGENVFTNRRIHIDHDCLAEIVIHTESEAVSLLDQAPKRYKRDLNIVLEIFTKGITEDEQQDKLDLLCWQIENLLAQDDDWGGNINHVNLTNVRLEFQENGTNPIGACIMTYQAEYLTELPDITTQTNLELVDLDRIQGLDTGDPDTARGWDIVTEEGDPDGAIDAELIVETEP